MKERVLITGASGFIGYHIIQEALKNNLEVYAAIRKSSNIAHLKDLDIKYTYPDFGDVSSLKKELAENKYDYIIHAAGATKARSQEEYNTINAGYTQNLATAALESGIQLKKFVLLGSLAAVGPLNNLKEVLTENSIPNPVTAYGKSKLLGEEKLKAFATLNFTILKPTGVYGPRDKDIFIFFKQIARGLEPYIGHTEQKFSFLYVTDLAKATIKALFNGNKGTFILSDGKSYDRYQLAGFIKDSMGVKAIKFHLPVKFVKIIAYLSEKYCALNKKASTLNVEKLNELMAVSWHCDIGNARKDLGFEPEYDLKAGVAESIKWYKTNKWL
ncbi:NAD-dependent epimerase/dehydratase family protein [Mucilaginibacter gotjawali]|uniref:Nucleoside-diphosphate-sugar epimerase n=2 Tax=Mucilaginibacter gotjawali TaxID=1550579 RepID=A0A839SBV8_9SPHI|nr:NAD(P)-dependent oxidoreductase [Mucilaginibacter gotjawali]MBB3054169.1 nucleoside-diphosphate-sugar epimerase [Mucilaginibacter gotjawali]BAU54440.1 3 beta-hydroxysteroid dehydrogenase/Delta 5-->4-isomerase [Mucilaginibacter gotjawali]